LSFPEPTDRVSPDEWAIPGGAWLCIPMMFAALAVGVAGVRVAWTWALLDRESGRIADRLASGKRPEAGSLELLLERELELPMASWRTSTADAMIARAALLSGPGPGFDPAAQERAGGLIHAAGASSPGHPGLRFARAWRAVQEPGADPPSMAVGLSRDIWPLAWSARALLSAGKADEARRAYLKAMDLACRAAPDGSAPPRFHADPQGGHFGLPLEGVIGVIVADMADRPEWSSEDWLELIPESSLAWLVAARVLRQRGDEAADRALERAIALADEPTPPGCSAAIHLAAGAEAMALDGRLEEAAGRYREAISRLSQAEEPARRPWMFNLADLLGRLDDRQGEREALLAAMITDPDDPVTAEAIRSQLRRGVDLVGAVGGEGEDRETFGE
jgi:tetratricopeptide (TPR) repeat protein